MKIFVYGTLMTGFENYKKYLDGNICSIEHGITRGRLYHLPEGYPALVDGQDIIKGEIIEIKESKILEDIDFLEEYKGEGEENLYNRVEVKVKSEEGEDFLCWTYFYVNKNYAESDGRYITGGDWKKFIQENIEELTEKYFAYGKDGYEDEFLQILSKCDCDKNFKLLGRAKLPDYKKDYSFSDDTLNIIPCKNEAIMGTLYEIPLKAVEFLDESKYYEKEKHTVFLDNKEYMALIYEKMKKY